MEIQETKITKTSSRERWRPRLTSRYLSEDNSFSFPFIALSPVTQHLPAPPCFPLLHPFWWICWVKGPTYQMSFLPLVTSLLYWTLSSQLPWEFNLPGSPRDSVRPLPAQLQVSSPCCLFAPSAPLLHGWLRSVPLHPHCLLHAALLLLLFNPHLRRLFPMDF